MKANIQVTANFLTCFYLNLAALKMLLCSRNFTFSSSETGYLCFQRPAEGWRAGCSKACICDWVPVKPAVVVAHLDWKSTGSWIGAED